MLDGVTSLRNSEMFSTHTTEVSAYKEDRFCVSKLPRLYSKNPHEEMTSKRQTTALKRSQALPRMKCISEINYENTIDEEKENAIISPPPTKGPYSNEMNPVSKCTVNYKRLRAQKDVDGKKLKHSKFGILNGFLRHENPRYETSNIRNTEPISFCSPDVTTSKSDVRLVNEKRHSLGGYFDSKYELLARTKNRDYYNDIDRRYLMASKPLKYFEPLEGSVATECKIRLNICDMIPVRDEPNIKKDSTVPVSKCVNTICKSVYTQTADSEIFVDDYFKVSDIQQREKSSEKLTVDNLSAISDFSVMYPHEQNSGIIGNDGDVVFCSTFSYPLHSTLLNDDINISDINIDTSSVQTCSIKCIGISCNTQDACKLSTIKKSRTDCVRLQNEFSSENEKKPAIPARQNPPETRPRSNWVQTSRRHESQSSELSASSNFEPLNPEEYKLVFGNPAESSQNWSDNRTGSTYSGSYQSRECCCHQDRNSKFGHTGSGADLMRLAPNSCHMQKGRYLRRQVADSMLNRRASIQPDEMAPFLPDFDREEINRRQSLQGTDCPTQHAAKYQARILPKTVAQLRGCQIKINKHNEADKIKTSESSCTEVSIDVDLINSPFLSSDDSEAPSCQNKSNKKLQRSNGVLKLGISKNFRSSKKLQEDKVNLGKSKKDKKFDIRQRRSIEPILEESPGASGVVARCRCILKSKRVHRRSYTSEEAGALCSHHPGQSRADDTRRDATSRSATTECSSNTSRRRVLAWKLQYFRQAVTKGLDTSRLQLTSFGQL